MADPSTAASSVESTTRVLGPTPPRQAPSTKVNGEIADLLTERTFADVAALGAALIDLDGIASKFRLGANAIVGVSMAVARRSAPQRRGPNPRLRCSVCWCR